MSGGLGSAWIKFGRATQHSVALKEEAIRFLNEHPEPTFVARLAGEVRAGGTGRCGVIIDRGYPEAPDLLSMILGDAVHGYRCALDHLAWRLVVAGGRSLTGEERAKVKFPI